MLAEGTLDVVLENTQMPAALLESQPYGRDYMVLAVPRSWPINSQLRAWQLSIENICSGKFLIPASVIGGFLGLLIGPEVLGQTAILKDAAALPEKSTLGFTRDISDQASLGRETTTGS